MRVKASQALQRMYLNPSTPRVLQQFTSGSIWFLFITCCKRVSRETRIIQHLMIFPTVHEVALLIDAHMRAVRHHVEAHERAHHGRAHHSSHFHATKQAALAHASAVRAVASAHKQFPPKPLPPKPPHFP